MIPMIRGILLGVPLAVGGLVAGAAAQGGFPGATFTVINHDTGQPIGSVSLCLTVNGQRMERMTDGNGGYTTTLQAGPNRVHFAKSGFQTTFVDITVPETGTELVPVKLRPGTSTGLPADCSTPATATNTGPGCLAITSVTVAGGDVTQDRTIRLKMQFSRRPEFIRVAEFTGAETYDGEAGFARVNPPWERYLGGDVTFTLTQPHFGTHVVHVQARLNSFGCVSAPRMKSVTLQPRQIVEHSLEGQALSQFLEAARARGYRFRHSLAVDVAVCGSGDLARALEVRDRTADRPLEIVRASYQVFDGPALNPYWSLASVTATHPDLPMPLGSSVGTKPNVEFGPVEVSCPECTPGSPRRTISWRRITYPSLGPFDGIMCVARSSDGPRLSRVVLRGPAGEDPVNALGSR
jgi:hypothetical protein